MRGHFVFERWQGNAGIFFFVIFDNWRGQVGQASGPLEISGVAYINVWFSANSLKINKEGKITLCCLCTGQRVEVIHTA